MIYKFITDSELDLGMKKYFREQITELQSKQHIQSISEGAAFSEIKSKLNGRYDLLKLFPTIKEWSETTAFLLDEYCSYKDIIYKCIQAGTNQKPDTAGSGYWKAEDPRDQLLVYNCAIMTVYKMLASAAPRKITQAFHDDYMCVLDWLDDIKRGEESPDWPLKEDGTSTIPWGSQEQNEHYY